MLNQEKKPKTLHLVEKKQDEVRFRRTSDGLLLFSKSGVKETIVGLQPCFPWSEPGEYFSVKNQEGEEIFLIDSIENLETPSRSAVLKALIEERFVFEVEDILYLEEEFELRVWKVQTKQGQRKFQTSLNSWPRELPDGSLLVKDVSGDLYLIANLEKMNRKAKEKIWAFMDE